jgi:ubiquinone/menaquinone biosynthesis C-methylase UbiE
MVTGMTVDFERTQPADYLTRLAASSLGHAYKALVVQQMAIERGHTVIDLGCGPGADLRAFAESVGPSGTVLGLDSDESAVEQARRAVADLTNVQVATGDLHQLDLPREGIDRAHTDRVLQHVVDPSRALAEVYRVLRPGGSAVFAEPDWDTLVIDFPRPAVASGYRRFITDGVVRNSRIGRQLPRLAQAAGLIVTSVVPVTAVFRDANEADKILGFHRVTERAVSTDYLSAADAEKWLAHLASAPFFASATLFVTVAERR